MSTNPATPGPAEVPFISTDPRTTWTQLQSQKRITILYDAFGPLSSLKMDWGFAALIEYNGRRILFDTGNNAKIFEHNVNQLNIDLTRLDAVVISHRHGDHTSGLNHLVKINPTVKIYVPDKSAYFNRPTAGMSASTESLEG